MIFDEATSALDIKIEKKIIDYIFKISKNNTIIFITHRKSFLHKFEKIIEVKKNKVYLKK